MRPLLSLLCCAILTTHALASEPPKPPTDEQIEEVLANLKSMRKQLSISQVSRAGYKFYVSDTLASLPFEIMPARQILKLEVYIWNQPWQSELVRTVDIRLVELMKDEGSKGAIAAVARLRINYCQQPDYHRRWLKDVLIHPGLPQAIRKGECAPLFYTIDNISKATLVSLKNEILAFEPVLDKEIPPAFVKKLTPYFRTLKKMGTAVDEATVKRVRIKIVKLHEKAIKQSIANEDLDLANELRRSLAFMDGSSAKGELVGQPAPNLPFLWFEDTKEIKSLADLRGKVVVLDFWTTWCGACIASFPKIQQLQDRYRNSDVAIIGVTWLQGKVYPPKALVIDTKDDPQKEYEVTTRIAKDNGATWPIAFGEAIFVEGFGIRSGIPRVVIIDAQGIVRYEVLDYQLPLQKKINIIDRLLKEAGLDVPQPIEFPE